VVRDPNGFGIAQFPELHLSFHHDVVALRENVLVVVQQLGDRAQGVAADHCFRVVAARHVRVGKQNSAACRRHRLYQSGRLFRGSTVRQVLERVLLFQDVLGVCVHPKRKVFGAHIHAQYFDFFHRII